MAIICKLRAYEVKQSTGCPTVLQNLAILLGISILFAGTVLGVCFLTEPTDKAAKMKNSSAPAQVTQHEPVVSSTTN
jgi:hypothetical protein